MKASKEDVYAFIKERATAVANKSKINKAEALLVAEKIPREERAAYEAAINRDSRQDGTWQSALAWKFHNIYLEAVDEFARYEREYFPPDSPDGMVPPGGKGGVSLGRYDDTNHLTHAELEDIFLEVVEKDCMGEDTNFTKVLASESCRLGLFYYGISKLRKDDKAWFAGKKSERGTNAANMRWKDSPKKEAICRAYKAWQGHSKTGRYRSKLARDMVNNGPGIKGVLEDPKGLAEKFSKWEKGEELPEC